MADNIRHLMMMYALNEAGEDDAEDEDATDEGDSTSDDSSSEEAGSDSDGDSNNVGQQTSDTPTEGEAPEIPDLGDPPGSTDSDDGEDGDFSIDGDADSEEDEDESSDDEESDDSESSGGEDEGDLNSAEETNYQTTVLELNKLDRQIATRKLFNLFQEMERNVMSHVNKIEASETVKNIDLRQKTVDELTKLGPIIRDYMNHKFRYTGYEENFQMYALLASNIVKLNNTLAEEGF